jgi:uncharacterized protein YjdB
VRILKKVSAILLLTSLIFTSTPSFAEAGNTVMGKVKERIDSTNIKTVAVTRVVLSASTLSVAVGASSSLTATIAPTNATNKNVMWESSNPNVAIVNNGIVKAIGVGKAVIKATTLNGNKTSNCTVTVATVTDVKLSRSQMSLTVGKSTILKPIITPSNAAVKDVRWEVTEGQSIIVTKYGKVIAFKNGLSKVRVTTADGGHSFDCEINVTGETVTLVNSLTLTNVKTGKNIGMLLVGKSATVSSSVSGENKKTPTNKNLLWKSSDEKIAWVDDNGKVYGVAPGKVTKFSPLPQFAIIRAFSISASSFLVNSHFVFDL